MSLNNLLKGFDRNC